MTSTHAPVRAHLLVQADPGTAPALRQYLAGIPGVVSASGTSGPYDAVAQVIVDGEAELRRVLKAGRSAPGLGRLCLCRVNASSAGIQRAPHGASAPAGSSGDGALPVGDEIGSPCTDCGRYTCRCGEGGPDPAACRDHPVAADAPARSTWEMPWMPWSAGLAMNA